jgi:hypothetical protein
MLFILKHSDHSVEKQRELRRWYFDNRLLYSALADPALLDSVAQTVTVNEKVPKAGQEELDFPEFVVDATGEPVTVTRVIHLTAMPLKWMLTMAGAWNPGQISAVQCATASR